MGQFNRFVFVAVVAAGTLSIGGAACGGGGDDDGGGSGNPGFIIPTDAARAFVREGGVWMELGPANLDCLGTPWGEGPTQVAITVSGVVEDLQSGEVVVGASIEAYDGVDFSAAPVATATSGADGSYSLELPAGVGRIAYKNSHEDALDTYLLNQLYEPDEAQQSTTLNSVSILTANALSAFIGVTRTPGLGVLAGAMRDCDGHEIGGAIATVSATPCAGDPSCEPQHLEGAQTYYFSAQATSLPVRLSQQQNTNDDGRFVVIELPVVTEAYLQVWAVDPADDEFKLISEIAAPVEPDAVITASMDPLRE